MTGGSALPPVLCYLFVSYGRTAAALFSLLRVTKNGTKKSVPFLMLKFADYLAALSAVFLFGNDSRGERVFKGF